VADKGVVPIKGKNYKLIVQRVMEFRSAHPDWGMHSEVIHHDEDRVIVKVWITDAEGRVRGTGLAEEDRKASRINETSAMENCETSAFGRALASIGFGGDVAYASAEEVANAINTQAQAEASEYLKAHMDTVHKYFDEIVAIKTGIANSDFISAGGTWFDLHETATEEELGALKLARTKGGIWSTAESAQLKADGEVSRVANKMRKENAA
jgi:hypothetical protein